MVEMGCTNWEAGLTSSDISVSPSIVMPRRSIMIPRQELPSVPQVTTDPLHPLPQLKLESLLATPTSFWQHHIGPSSATSSSFKNIQFTSPYISFYKDQ